MSSIQALYNRLRDGAMQGIEFAEAIENGEKGSSIDLMNTHVVPILISDRANAVLECSYWSHTTHFER
jgi:hypothetical protein